MCIWVLNCENIQLQPKGVVQKYSVLFLRNKLRWLHKVVTICKNPKENLFFAHLCWWILNWIPVLPSFCMNYSFCLSFCGFFVVWYEALKLLILFFYLLKYFPLLHISVSDYQLFVSAVIDHCKWIHLLIKRTPETVFSHYYPSPQRSEHQGAPLH